VQGEVLLVPAGWCYSELLLDECISVEGVLVLADNTGNVERVEPDVPIQEKGNGLSAAMGAGLQWGSLVSSGAGFKFCL
jgi:hypothetical protein